MGSSCLLATITIGGLGVRRVLRAASAADTDDLRELSVEEHIEEQFEDELADEPEHELRVLLCDK